MLKPLSLRPVSLKPVTLRPFGYNGSNTSYLIKNGIPTGCSYLYPGDRVIDGRVFGANEPPVVGGELWGHGSLINKLSWSDDFLNPIWAQTNTGVELLGETVNRRAAYKVTKDTPGVYDATLTCGACIASGDSRSIWVRAGSPSDAGKTVHTCGRAGYGPLVTLTADWELVFRPPPGSEPGDINFYAVDFRDSAALSVDISHAEAIEGLEYSIFPVTIGSEGAPTSIQTAAASPIVDDLHGLTAPCPVGSRLHTLLTGGVGTLYHTYALRPSLAQLQTVGHINLIGRDADRGVGVDIIRINSTSGLFEAVDSAGNVAQSAQAYTPEQLHEIELHFDGSQMWLVVDGVAGSKVTFSGTFDPGENIKMGIGCEDISRHKTLKYRMVA